MLKASDNNQPQFDHTSTHYLIQNETAHLKRALITQAKSEGSAEPAHPSSLTFIVCSHEEASYKDPDIWPF